MLNQILWCRVGVQYQNQQSSFSTQAIFHFIFSRYMKQITFSIAVLVLVFTSSAQDNRIYPKNDKIQLQADVTTTKSILGKGFDREMLEVGTVIKNPKIEIINDVNQYSASCQVVTDELVLKGCAKYFIASGGFEAAKKKRYSFIRVYKITKVEKIDVPSDIQLTLPAKLVASAVYYGYLFDVMVEGTQESMSADIGFKLLGAGTSFNSMTKSYNLRTQVTATGLRPKGGENNIVLATSPEEIQNNFVADKKPQPIFVEYKFLDNVEVAPFTFASYKIVAGKSYVKSIYIKFSDRKIGGQKWDPFDTQPEISINMFKVNIVTKKKKDYFSEKTNTSSIDAFWDNLGTEIELYENEVLFIQAFDHDGELGGHDPAGLLGITLQDLENAEYGEIITLKKPKDQIAVDECKIVLSKKP